MGPVSTTFSIHLNDLYDDDTCLAEGSTQGIQYRWIVRCLAPCTLRDPITLNAGHSLPRYMAELNVVFGTMLHGDRILCLVIKCGAK